jgi:hypothetical protein
MTSGPFALRQNPIHISDQVLEDLYRRLKATRYPVDAGNADWYYGVERTYLTELVDYWIDEYDWRKAEAQINGDFEQ